MFKKIWFYIHWFLGLVAGIILLVVGLTGSILSFEKEILHLMNQKSYFVQVSDSERLSPDALLNSFKEKMPEAKISSMTLFLNPKASAVIAVQSPNAQGQSGGHGGGHGKNTISHFVNPYTGEILPQAKGVEFFRIVLDLHRRLMAGAVGKQIVAASTVALIILSLTGVYLYWGSIRRSLKSSLSINFKVKGRGFLYKLHSASGLWMLPFLLLISLTGLFWSYEWYNEALYKIAGVEKPKKNMNQQQTKVQDKDRPMVDESIPNKPSGERGEKGSRGAEALSGLAGQNITRAWNVFNSSVGHSYESATLRMPISGTKYDFSYLDKDAQHTRTRNSLFVDIKEGKVLSHTRYDEKRINEKIMVSMLPLHSGEYFGIIGRIWVFLASNGMLLFGITGLMLYLDRRKKAQIRVQRAGQ